MSEPHGSYSAGGVWIADDFRDNLIIDRYDPAFSLMRASKRKLLRSQNSEDAVTWNVFRSLRQIDPGVWLPVLWAKAFTSACPSTQAIVRLWSAVAPPPALVADLDEGHSEIDIVLESDRWVWFIEAKYRSDISGATTTRPDRDQVLRNIDVGSYYAGVRDFYFSLLVHDPRRSPDGMAKVAEYKNLEMARERLPHRPDRLTNLREVSSLTWADLATVLQHARTSETREEERQFAVRAAEWLSTRGIVDNASDDA
jgi:hypothetical protein